MSKSSLAMTTSFPSLTLYRLCHLVHGPHDEPFHKLWNQLRTEHEQLLSKGYTGEGFLSTGHKLGGARMPMHEARRQARAAAEKRRTLTAGSGQKLGGAPARSGQDIRRVIADAAARRTAVTKGCGSGTERERGIVEETTRNGFRTKAEEEDANEEAIMQVYIDLIQEEEKEKYGDAYIPPSKENPAGSQSTSTTAPPPIPNGTKPRAVVDLTSSSPTGSPSLLAEKDSWSCLICTLSNPFTYLYCDACATERPSRSQPRSAPGSERKIASKSVNSLLSLGNSVASQKPRPLGWLCHHCGTFMESEWWTCSSCGTMKLTS